MNKELIETWLEQKDNDEIFHDVMWDFLHEITKPVVDYINSEEFKLEMIDRMKEKGVKLELVDMNRETQITETFSMVKYLIDTTETMDDIWKDVKSMRRIYP